jgi:hypothetical protein
MTPPPLQPTGRGIAPRTGAVGHRLGRHPSRSTARLLVAYSSDRLCPLGSPVADGRPRVIAVEAAIAAAFVVVAAAILVVLLIVGVDFHH